MVIYQTNGNHNRPPTNEKRYKRTTFNRRMQNIAPSSDKCKRRCLYSINMSRASDSCDLNAHRNPTVTLNYVARAGARPALGYRNLKIVLLNNCNIRWMTRKLEVSREFE